MELRPNLSVAQHYPFLRRQTVPADGAAEVDVVGGLADCRAVTVLEAAAGGEYLPDRAAMRNIYLRLKELDDGLLPLERTNLMRLPCWS